jgi:cellulose synthase/poly-beta-1,6-N-acetylglucosamine synthase-like glycosyltransferase
MNWIRAIIVIVEIILSIYLLLPLVLLGIHYFKIKIIGYRSPVVRRPLINKDFHFAAIITAYQDTRFIEPLVDSLLKQTYANVRIYVVADDCDISLLHFDEKRVVVIKPDVALHAKIKSISLAIEHFETDDEVLVIFDSDNLVHPKYFEYLNHYFRQGYRAVQTHMLSKNTDTRYARLDSIGHIYYTFLDRQVRMELGISSCILGLGIAIERELYRSILYKNNNLGGFDKKLQADIVLSIPQLAFAEEAIVFDEKVEDGDALEKQRTRWLFTYFKYFKINMGIFIAGIRRLNLKLIYFGFVSLRPPLFILLGLYCLFVFINLFISVKAALVMLFCLFLFVLGFVLIVITQSRQKGVDKALLHLPLVVIRQFKALFKMNKAKSSFLKTEHTKVLYIDELLKNGSF